MRVESRGGGPAGASHELVDHTSEVTIRARAPTFGGLIQEATAAFGEFVPDSLARDPDPSWREVEVEGGDRAAALVAWLNEMVYLCEVSRWLAVEVELIEESAERLRLRARGEMLEEPFVLVKAATLHGAHVSEAPDGLRAEVTLDV